MASDCAAKIASQQDRAKNGATRDHIDHKAGQFNDSQGEHEVLGVAKLGSSFHSRCQLEHLYDAVKD